MSSANDTRSEAAQDHAPIQVVLFDYGQVLSMPPDPAAWRQMQQVTGLSEQRLHKGYWEFRHRYDEGILLGRDYWQQVARHGEIELDESKLDRLIELDTDLWTQPNPPMIAWAQGLQRAGVRTAILSNIGDAMAIGVTARLVWLKDFERCIWSYALRMAKPDPEIFRRTAAMLRTPPEAVLFVDDKPENIAAAAGIGMQAIGYASHDEFEKTMRDRGFASLLDATATTACD